MKKRLCIIVAMLMALSICTACAGSSQGTPHNSQHNQQSQPQEIRLNAGNIKEYLAFEFDYSKVERKSIFGASFGYTDITMKTYATKGGSFNNVQITIKITLTNGWSVSSDDEAYKENNTETLTLTFRLPSSGEYTDTHDLIAALVYSNPDSQNVQYKITSVTGTFDPN